MTATRSARGELALVLHTHMPYVGGFGTWPFGEEWLWEAIATSYLPLLDVLDGPGGDAITLSVTPVLADQLEVPGALERCVRFLEEIRLESHRLDAQELAAVGQGAPAPSSSDRPPSTRRRRGGCAS